MCQVFTLHKAGMFWGGGMIEVWDFDLGSTGFEGVELG